MEWHHFPFSMPSLVPSLDPTIPPPLASWYFFSLNIIVPYTCVYEYINKIYDQFILVCMYGLKADHSKFYNQ